MNKKTAIANYMRAQEAYEAAEEGLKKAFAGYKDLLKEGLISEAKEFCRSWPDSSSKVLAFREIILAERSKNRVSHEDSYLCRPAAPISRK